MTQNAPEKNPNYRSYFKYGGKFANPITYIKKEVQIRQSANVCTLCSFRRFSETPSSTVGFFG